MKVEILPYVGINEIKFGMSQQEVELTLGRAAKIEIDNIMEETREYRDGMVFTFIENKLMDISISLHIHLFYKEIDIFNSENTLDLLSKHDNYNEAKIKSNGYANFYGLGISLGGFGNKRIPEKKLAIIFAKDRIDFYKAFLEV